METTTDCLRLPNLPPEQSRHALFKSKMFYPAQAMWIPFVGSMLCFPTWREDRGEELLCSLLLGSVLFPSKAASVLKTSAEQPSSPYFCVVEGGVVILS